MKVSTLGSRLHDRLVDWRIRLGTAAFDTMFYGLDKIGRLHPKADPARHAIERLADIPYCEDGERHHLLDVYRPEHRPESLPVMIYVHGGGFRILSKDTHWLMAILFAQRGFVVFNINYRLAPPHPYPAAVEDTFMACTWIKEHAREYGGDPDRIHLAGESAGANLITSVAVASAYRHPQSWSRKLWEAELNPRTALPACGLLQASHPERFWKNRHLNIIIRDRLMEVRHNYLPDWNSWDRARLALADPLCVLERGIPPERPLPAFFAFAGSLDPLMEDTNRLEVALNALGTPCETRCYQGGAHAFHAFIWTQLAKECWRDQFRFLTPHMDERFRRPAPG